MPGQLNRYPALLRPQSWSGLCSAWLLVACTNPGVERLTPLAPGALEGRTHPIPNLERVVFLAYGDAGFGDDRQRRVGASMATVCCSRACNFVVGLGDNHQGNGFVGVDDPAFADRFEVPYAAFGAVDFWLTLGNHDWMGAAQAEIDYTLRSDRWRMPAQGYAVPDLPSWLNIVTFDAWGAEQLGSLAESQLAVLREGLCGKPGWLIAVGHVPAYSSGEHGDDSFIQGLLTGELSPCAPQLYLSGHDHDQELMVTPELTQVVAGSAADVRKLNGRGANSTFAREGLGFVALEVTATTLLITFYDGDGEVVFEKSLTL